MANIIIGGDFVFKPEDESRFTGLMEDSFKDIQNIVNGYDYSIVNLESPVISNKPTPIKKSGPNIYSSPIVFSILKYIGIKGLTIANNHLFDQGQNGLIETLRRCDENRLQYFGGGLSREEAETTKIIDVKGKKVAVINCCEIEFSIATDKHGGANPMIPLKQYYAIKKAKDKADVVILIVHGGIEHFPYPTLNMQDTYRFFIDAGADVIINHHQHCFSGYEIYNNSPIIYGTGNLFFPRAKYKNTFWNYGYLVGIDLDNISSIQLIPYNQCSDGINIHLFEDIEKVKFHNEITRLNNIICNRQELTKINESFMEETGAKFDWLFLPYEGKFLRKLCSKGLLPKLFSYDRADLIRALINCQSHFDRFNYYLKSKTTRTL